MVRADAETLLAYLPGWQYLDRAWPSAEILTHVGYLCRGRDRALVEMRAMGRGGAYALRVLVPSRDGSRFGSPSDWGVETPAEFIFSPDDLRKTSKALFEVTLLDWVAAIGKAHSSCAHAKTQLDRSILTRRYTQDQVEDQIRDAIGADFVVKKGRSNDIEISRKETVDDPIVSVVVYDNGQLGASFRGLSSGTLLKLIKEIVK